MAEVKSFTFADEPMSEEDVSGSFELNGVMFDVRKLKDSALPVLMHKIRSGKPDMVLAAVLEFAELALTPASAKLFIEKHLSPVTGLKMEQIVLVFTEIMAVVGRSASYELEEATKPRQSKRSVRS